MQISKARLKKGIKEKMFAIFYQTIADIKNQKEAKLFLTDFLTKMEQTSLAKMLMIAYLLEKGKSYDEIKKTIKVSSATIANVDRMMAKNTQGFVLALKKIEAEEWAGETIKKVSRFINRLIANK